MGRCRHQIHLDWTPRTSIVASFDRCVYRRRPWKFNQDCVSYPRLPWILTGPELFGVRALARAFQLVGARWVRRRPGLPCLRHLALLGGGPAGARRHPARATRASPRLARATMPPTARRGTPASGWVASLARVPSADGTPSPPRRRSPASSRTSDRARPRVRGGAHPRAPREHPRLHPSRPLRRSTPSEARAHVRVVLPSVRRRCVSAEHRRLRPERPAAPPRQHVSPHRRRPRGRGSNRRLPRSHPRTFSARRPHLGFLVDAEQYASYARRLCSWGYVVLQYNKRESVGVAGGNALDDVVSAAMVKDLIGWAQSDVLLGPQIDRGDVRGFRVGGAFGRAADDEHDDDVRTGGGVSDRPLARRQDIDAGRGGRLEGSRGVSARPGG